MSKSKRALMTVEFWIKDAGESQGHDDAFLDRWENPTEIPRIRDFVALKGHCQMIVVERHWRSVDLIQIFVKGPESETIWPWR